MLILLAGTFCIVASLLHITSVFVVIARIHNDDLSAHVLPNDEGVTIIRPVCGIENFVEETLRSTFRLDYPSYEILFCVADAADPVIPLVRRLMAEHPRITARLLTGNDNISPNPKLNNVAKGWHAARHDWILMADSNVLMPRDYIQRVLATWRADTGLVCSPPIGCVPKGIWAELECAFLNTYQARWQCFADSIGWGFAQGKTMLWRRDILEKAGGIEALGAEAAEDAAATKLVRRLGLRVRLIDDPFRQPLGVRSAAGIWGRQIRWARLRRDTFKLLFLPEILAGSVLPIAACGVVAAAVGWPVASSTVAFAVAWYAFEALLAYAAGWHLSRWSPVLWMIRDLLLPVLWITSWVGNSFEWRGNTMRIADPTVSHGCHRIATEISENSC